jgi:alpha-glucosidase (family GH31 glycosyl hydrolase)
MVPLQEHFFRNISITTIIIIINLWVHKHDSAYLKMNAFYMKYSPRFLFYILLITIATFFSMDANSQKATLQWKKMANGVWKAEVGKPELINFLTISGVHPKTAAINNMPLATFPITENEIKVEVYDGKTYLRFPLDKNEKIFGLGLNFKTVEQRGRILKLHEDHYGGIDNGRSHAPIPFYVSSKGYGVFINSTRYLDIWVGTGVRVDSKNPPDVRDRNTDKKWSASPYSDNVEVLVPTEGVELFVFGGPTTLDAVSRFNLYQGGGCLPPKWGLGFWHRTPTLFNAEQLLNEVDGFTKHQFPLTVIGLEPGWQSKSYPCTYEWDSNRFPDPKGLIKTLKDKGIYTNLWINPYISPEAKFINVLKPFIASHTVWSGYIPDYSMKQTNAIIGNHLKKNLLDIGVSGFKMDENDGFDFWLWPDVTKFPSKIPAEIMRQTYGMMMQKLNTNLYHAKNQRTYGLVRATNAGATSYPFVIYNDYYSHRDFITALINSSFIGTLWTPEVRSSGSAEDWLRRMQTVCFSPIAMLNAWADGTKPWTFPEVEKEVADVANLRMQLIPYLYTCFAEYAFYGRPPIRAMNLVDGFLVMSKETIAKVDSEKNPYAIASKKEIKDQYMMGDNLLIAPLFTGETSRKIILPIGKWYDFYTGELAGESEIISVTPGLAHIPVFVRDGGIIPMAVTNTIAEGKFDLVIRYYGQKEATYLLYDDDGKTFDYEKGDFSWRTLKVKRDQKGNFQGTISEADKGKPNNIGKLSWEFKTK